MTNGEEIFKRTFTANTLPPPIDPSSKRMKELMRQSASMGAHDVLPRSPAPMGLDRKVFQKNTHHERQSQGTESAEMFERNFQPLGFTPPLQSFGPQHNFFR